MDFENAPQKLLVEAIGTFALCFMGCGAIVMTQGQDLVAIALAHGLAIGLVITAAGHISGGHFNPAVTLGALVTRRIEPGSAVAYFIAQFIGGVLGAAALILVFLDIDRNAVDLGLPKVGSSLSTDPVGEIALSTWNALAMEAMLTFFLMFVIYGVAFDRRTGGRAVAGLAIGLTITMGNFVGAAVSGAAMNPARWFGPAVIQGDYSDFWVWIVGPAIGAVVAALVYNEFLLGRSSNTDEVEEFDTDVAPAAVQTAPPPARKRPRRKR